MQNTIEGGLVDRCERFENASFLARTVYVRWEKNLSQR